MKSRWADKGVEELFEWNDFNGAAEYVYDQVSQRSAEDYNRAYSFMKYAISMNSNNQEEGYEEAWFALEKAVLEKFDQAIKKIKQEKENHIRRIQELNGDLEQTELEEYDIYIEELELYKKRAKKIVRPNWIRETLRRA